MRGSPPLRTKRLSEDTVKFAHSFGIGKFEVTQKEWVAVMGNNPSLHQGASLPVDFVSLEQIEEFLQRLRTKNRARVSVTNGSGVGVCGAIRQ